MAEDKSEEEQKDTPAAGAHVDEAQQAPADALSLTPDEVAEEEKSAVMALVPCPETTVNPVPE